MGAAVAAIAVSSAADWYSYAMPGGAGGYTEEYWSQNAYSLFPVRDNWFFQALRWIRGVTVADAAGCALGYSMWWVLGRDQYNEDGEQECLILGAAFSIAAF